MSFGTRHTLSETASETRGIGAARRWIKAEFEKFLLNVVAAWKWSIKKRHFLAKSVFLTQQRSLTLLLFNGKNRSKSLYCDEW